jgi:hypothetical protein
MKKLTIIALFAAAALVAFAAAGKSQTFTGVITDSMCVNNHAMMHITPDDKCVRKCVRAGAKYVLYDGKTAYKLSDQQTPEKFAAQKVKLTGVPFPATGIIQVEKIEAAK